jgi:hypothetical protein
LKAKAGNDSLPERYDRRIQHKNLHLTMPGLRWYLLYVFYLLIAFLRMESLQTTGHVLLLHRRLVRLPLRIMAQFVVYKATGGIGIALPTSLTIHRHY